MEIENLIRYTPRTVGLKPSARQGKARLRGLYRNYSSSQIRWTLDWISGTFHLRLRRAEALSEVGQALRAGSTWRPLGI